MKNRESAPLVYLDHAAGTPLLPSVVEQHEELCRRFYFNPHSTHQYSENCVRAIENATESILGILGIARDEAEVIWTSGGTEANNLAILGCLREQSGRRAAMVESAAHSSVLAPARAFADEGGEYLEIPVDRSGNLDLEQIAPPNIAPAGVMALCHVNNETGAIQDLTSIRHWLDEHIPKSYFAVDALQSFTRLDIDWRGGRIDMLTLGGRKIGGPPHVGALIMRRGTPLKPIIFGGGQQRGFRPGTMDTIGIIEFAAAAVEASKGRDENLNKARDLRDYLDLKLKRTGLEGYRILSPPDGSPYIINFTLPGYEGAILMRALAEKNIIIATGSACSAESASTSHVLEAMGISRRTARSALRVSFGRDTTREDIDRLVEALLEVAASY